MKMNIPKTLKQVPAGRGSHRHHRSRKQTAIGMDRSEPSRDLARKLDVLKKSQPVLLKLS